MFLFIYLFILLFNNAKSKEVFCYKDFSKDQVCSIQTSYMPKTAEDCCNHQGQGFNEEFKQIQFEVKNLYECKFCKNYEWAGEWGPWSQCSVSCNIGKRERKKDCRKDVISGKNCYGKDIEQEKCEEMKCPQEESSSRTSVLIIACLGTALSVLVILIIIFVGFKKKCLCFKKTSSTPRIANSSKGNDYITETDIDGYLNPSSRRKSNPEDHIYDYIPYYTYMDQSHNVSTGSQIYDEVYNDLQREKKTPKIAELKKAEDGDYIELLSESEAERFHWKNQTPQPRDELEDTEGYLCMRGQENIEEYICMTTQKDNEDYLPMTGKHYKCHEEK